jgi:cell shape-determining protein MreD
MNGTPRPGFWAFVGLLVILHFVLRIGLGFAHLAPDLLLVALLLAARETRAGYAAGLGLLFGILDGAVVPFNLGASALVLTILGFAGGRSRDLFSGDNFVFLAVYLFAGKWLYDTLLYLLSGNILSPEATYLVLVSPLTAVYAAAAGLVSLALYRAFA